MTIRKLPGSQIESNTITITQIQTTAVTNIVTQAGPRVSSLIYPGNDTAGNTVGGQTVYINGSGFETNNAIYINGNAVPSKSFISASNLSFTTPALAAGIYPVYLINTDSGATAIFVPGYISSAEPSWVTSAGSLTESQDELTAWSYSLSATGDAPITYALAAGSSLPTGVSLAANGLISGTITSPSGNATTYTFSVIATDAQNQDSTRQFTVTTSTGEGVLFANNVLLIHADGTNNQNNHTFLDSSNNNFTITRNGNATQGSFSPFSQTGWSGYFDGNGDSLTYTGGGSSINFGTSDFTIELFVNMANTGTFSAFLRPDDNGTFLEFGYDWSTGQLKLDARNGAIANATTSITPNAWRHIAASRSGTSLRLFVDGTQVGTTVTNSTNFASTSGTIRIGGSDYSATHSVNGYISNFRILKGTALYTANSSPPTAALTNIANTSLLTLQSNRFIDNSNNNFTITRNGDTSIQVFSPFAPTAAYLTANVGGSGYFDGTGDYLNAPSSIWTSLAGVDTSFTVEAWVYPTGVSAQASEIIGINQSGQTSALSFRLTTAYALHFANWGSGYTNTTSADGVVKPYSWNHVAASKSGSSMKLFVNGVVVATQTISNGTINSFSKQLEIGGRSDDNATKFIGYMSGLRVVQGEALYTANTSPPTIPPTNVANTSLLCNFTNAGIFDQTAKNILETVGDAKVSTAQYKYGTGSMVFDGTGDYIKSASSNLNILGGEDFTIEFWLYPNNTTSAYRALVSSENYPVTTGGWSLYQNGTAIEFWLTPGSSVTINAASAITASTWQHLALCRASGTLRLFINGTSVASVSNSTSLTGQQIWIGDNNGGDYFFNGYIDDLRITKGYARYTSNFTAPTAALKDK